MKFTNLSVLILLFISNFAYAQSLLPKDYFRYPLDIKTVITGTFAELRPNHFHSGIDFSVSGQTGLNVYAVADGYVSRIKVSAGGYGKALYITHPNGFVSVYAHLNEYNLLLNDYVTRKQYEKESFEIELFPPSQLFYVKKGDIIGYSGNTGSSSGPHLHFEIRSELSERPINPFLFNIKPVDNRLPVVGKIRVYPSDNNSKINGHKNYYTYKVYQNSSGNYKIPEIINVAGGCYFGALISDYVSTSYNKAGIYSVDMSVNSQKYFCYTMDSFSFDESVQINDLIDYSEYVLKKERWQLMRKSPGNNLSIYNDVVNNGIFYPEQDSLYNIKLTACDFADNCASVTCIVKGLQADTIKEEVTEGFVIPYNSNTIFKTDFIKIEFAEDLLFYDIILQYEEKENKTTPYSYLHCIHDKYTALKNYYKIYVKSEVPDDLKTKVVVAKYNASGHDDYYNAVYKDGYVESETRYFGNYYVDVDTVPPAIEIINVRDGKNVSTLVNIKFKITDDKSGIESYRAEIDGKWLLMEYDIKSDILSAPVNEKIPQGNFRFVLTVTDKKGNESKIEYVLSK